MANQKISQLTEHTEYTGEEYAEVIVPPFTAGTNRKMLTRRFGVSREFNRAYTTELLFNKNMIEADLHVQEDDITFTVAESGNIVDQESIYGQRITVDGVHPIYFLGFNHLANIASGDILEAGTYQFIFWYSNGLVRGSVMLPSQETVMLSPLSIPGSFAGVPGAGDPETEIDLSWAAVANVSSYEIDYSTVGTSGPWTSLATPAAGDTSYTHTGLSPNTTYHHRIRAIGDQVSFGNSTYATDTTTTENSGDVTAPTFTFDPADAATDIAVNYPVIITASEPLIDADGTTVITDANITDYLVVKVDNGAGANIPYTATIDASKTIITITPNVVWPELDNVFIQISGVEDVNGNESATDDATFATSDYTIMNNNMLNFGSQLDSYLSGDDINFEIEFEFKDIILSGARTMTAKWESANLQVSHVWRTEEDNVDFKFYIRESATGFSARRVIWHDALNGVTEGKLEVKYFGAIDTNNGLDRCELYLDDVLLGTGLGAKSVVAENGSTAWPWAISGGTAPFIFAGPTFRQVRNLKFRNNMGATTRLDVPIIRTGEDVSGNSFDGTWT